MHVNDSQVEEEQQGDGHSEEPLTQLRGGVVNQTQQTAAKGFS